MSRKWCSVAVCESHRLATSILVLVELNTLLCRPPCLHRSPQHAHDWCISRHAIVQFEFSADSD